MSDQESIFVIESNDFAAAQIRAALARMGLGASVEIVAEPPSAADSSVIASPRPIRVGRILDQVCAHISAQDQPAGMLFLGARRVDRYRGFYYADENAEAVRLTEKEVALLVILAAAKGDPISRDQLLDDVWQYADGVETHTLETHIYRLRQKIEDDPSNPTFLKTNDAGYFLSFK